MAAAVAECEHLCGFQSKHLNAAHYHPQRAELLIYAAASVVIIEDVNDPHKQEFLRGHDAEVSALDVSQNGKLVASGQLGSPFRKGSVAPVVVWDFDNRQLYIEFNGLAHSALCVKFSPDGRFLAATGANQMIFVWDVSTGESVFSRRTESPCFLAVWGPIVANPSGGRYPSYMLCTTYDNSVLVNHLDFDIGSMSYTMRSDTVQFPSSGLQRKHICGIVHGDFLLTGTLAGDMCVFSLGAKVFRSSLPICNNGVTSITAHGELVYVAGGDGRVKVVRGSDTHWDVLAENVLEHGVVALTPSADGAELVAGTRNGKLWRLLTSDLTATMHSASHTGEATDVCFGPASEVVLTTSEAGEIFLTDLSDYMPVTTALAKSPVRSAVMASRGEILAVYDDGFLRCWSQQRGESTKLWEVHTHRGGATVVKESGDFIVTGGNDFAVRFWHRSSRELLATYTNHRKPVADLIIDNVKPHLVHSGAEDRLVVTYCLKKNKALIQHTTPASSVTGLSQRKDREHEVVSATLDGKLIFWDEDYADPTGCFDSPNGAVIRFRCCDISPSGRYIAAGAEDHSMYIYDLVTGGCIQQCQGHSGTVTRARWAPDQKQIVSAGRDGCVIVWNFFEYQQ